MKDIIDRACNINCITENDAKAVAALADLTEQLQSRLESLEKDAKKYARLPLTEWGELEYWLDRCYDKGHLEQCSDLIEPYQNLSNAIAAMQANKGE